MSVRTYVSRSRHNYCWLAASFQRSKVASCGPCLLAPDLARQAQDLHEQSHAAARRRHATSYRAGSEHFHYVLMRAGLSGRQVLAVLVAFSVLYAAVGLIGASEKLPDWALFAPWLTLLGLQHFIIRGLAVYLRLHRWRASKVVVKLPVTVVAAHSYETQPSAGREAA